MLCMFQVLNKSLAVLHKNLTSLFHNCLSEKMEFLFGRRKTPQEMLRQNQRALNKAMRDLDRERQHMEQQEKKVIADIKKMAKMGQMVKSNLFTKTLRGLCQLNLIDAI